MKNNLTFGQLDYLCMKAAGNLNESDIFKGVRQGYINSRLMKVYALLIGLNDPFYNRTTSLTVAADQERLADFTTNGGIITAINSTTKTIVRSSGVFVAGSIVAVTIYELAGTGIVVAQWIARITTGGATGTYTVLSGADATYLLADHGATVTVIKSLSVSTADLSGTYFRSIVRITDPNYTTTPGAKVRLFDRIEDPQVFYNLDKDPFAKDRIAWYLRGDTVDFFVGSTANAMGTPTAEYQGKPGVFTDSTVDDVIDLPPEYNQVLIDEVTTAYVIDRGKKVPDDVAARLKLFYEASEAQLAKTKSEQNT